MLDVQQRIPKEMKAASDQAFLGTPPQQKFHQYTLSPSYVGMWHVQQFTLCLHLIVIPVAMHPTPTCTR
ncbi:hypothetical protein TNCT_349591 [Trichonephila clavata]|uniref:Uncharacterized protein n=1 Tax=Trichonephila clavata TaxID=2740835 RepID=A0A8X6KWF4_TRICU|nr:hypothetical protein TNCT_349591 [Trichonephila clavata]